MLEEVNTLYGAIKKRIADAVTIEAEYLVGGKCGSHEEYKKRCGIIHGLNQAMEIFKTALQVQHFADEEE